MSNDNKSHSTAIAKAFIERSTTMGLKGKARDRAALEFAIGAANALDIAGIKDSGATFFAFMVATRGYGQVLDAAKADA